MKLLMDGFVHPGTYKYKNCRTLDNKDSTTDVTTVGMDYLIKNTNSPLKDYNIAFFYNLQRRRATKPVAGDTQPLPTESRTPIHRCKQTYANTKAACDCSEQSHAAFVFACVCSNFKDEIYIIMEYQDLQESCLDVIYIFMLILVIHFVQNFFYMVV